MELSSRPLKFRLSVVWPIAAVIATALLLVVSSRAAQGATEIVFASGPDRTGTVQRLIDDFNEWHRGAIEVTWRQMDRESDAHRRQLVQAFETDADAIDLLASDVVWTAEFAKNGWVADVTDRFYDDYERAALLAPALGSAIYRLRIWGVPWYTDAGVLFYRKDKLAESGFTAPPATWDELRKMALKVMHDTETRYGFVFQGAAYEGGTVNAAEFIWSAGGEIMTSRPTVIGLVMGAVTETDAVTVASDAAAKGLNFARSLIVDGISPAAVTTFREREALEAFVAEDAVFLRSWPYVYGVLRQAGFSLDEFGVAPLPASSDNASASCLGGWNLMINARSSSAKQDAAWQLIRFLTQPAQQKRQAAEAGLLPVLESLYEDRELVETVPVIGLGKQVFAAQLRARPMSPFYSEISVSISRAFNRTLSGELTGSDATRLLDEELRAIVVRNR